MRIVSSNVTSESEGAMNRIAIPVMFFVTILLSLLLPMVRFRVRHGMWPMVGFQRTTGPVRVIYAAGAAWLVIFTVWIGGRFFLSASPNEVQPPLATSILGWTLSAAGLAMLVVAQAQMGRSWRIGIDPNPTALVTRGLYQFTRNPIYSAVLLLLLGLVFIAPGVATFALWLSVAIGVSVQVRLEERHLLAQHGASFRAYASRVGRFLPGFGLLRG